jgi:hypothetical protein
VESSTASKQAALWIGRIVHPFTVALLSVYFLGDLHGVGGKTIFAWMLVCLFTIIVPTFLLILKRSGFKDFDIRERAPRRFVYIFGMVVLVADLLMLRVFSGPSYLFQLLFAATLAAIGGRLVNDMTKISVHSAAISGAATAFAAVHTQVGIALFVTAFLVSWSRVHAKKHTLLQVCLGAIGAGLCMAFVLVVHKELTSL